MKTLLGLLHSLRCDDCILIDLTNYIKSSIFQKFKNYKDVTTQSWS